jgi:hypothetical protein
LIGGTVTAKVLSSRKQREKEDGIGESHSHSENDPYLFRMKFALGENRTRDLTLIRLVYLLGWRSFKSQLKGKEEALIQA